MQRLLKRLAWRNLRFQTKIVAALFFAVSLLTLVGVLAITLLVVVQQQEQAIFNSATEMRADAQGIQFKIESLALTQSRMFEDYNQLDYSTLSQNIPEQHQDSFTGLQEDIVRINALSTELAGEEGRQAIEAEIAIVQQALISNSGHFHAANESVLALRSFEGALQALVDRSETLEDVTIAQNNAALFSRLIALRGIEQTLIQTGSDDSLTDLENAANAYLVVYQNQIAATARDTSIPDAVEAYLEQASVVGQLIQEIERGQTLTSIDLDLARDSASRLNTVIERQFENALHELGQQRLRSRNFVITAFVLALIVGAITFILFGRDLSRRVSTLVDGARSLEAGDLQTRIDIAGEDEFSQLGRSVNAVAIQLDALIGGLEQRVAERTRDLSMTAEIGRLVVELREPRELMNEIVELVRDRFGFYHAQVFIVDDENSRANLVASTGGAGRQLLARGHYLPVGSQSVIGQVTSTGEPVVALDTDTDQVHRRNELLPDTRSEMALPMRIGTRVIGAMDVQSVASNAFDDDDVAVFQIIADQLAIALDNARLYGELQDTNARINIMESQATIEAWQAYSAIRSEPTLPLSYLLEDENVQPHEAATSSTMLQAAQQGELVRANDDEIDLAVPIKVRGEVIGVFGFGGPTLTDLSEDDLALVEAVIERVGLALENLRLLEDAARRADHERVVNEISSKIAGSTDVNYILQTAVKELGRVLRAPQTSVQLRQQDMDG